MPSGEHQPPAGEPSVSEEHEPSVNQHRHEPMPASHRASGDEPAVTRNEEHQPGAHPGPAEPGPAEPGPAEPGPAEPGPAEPGQAVRDLMGGPQPQGDVPDAPATQVAGLETEEDRVRRIRYVANAVPGKPDGEVDTRS